MLVFHKDERIVGRSVDAAFLHQYLAGNVGGEGISQSDILDLDEGAVVYSQRRIYRFLFVSRSGTREVCALIVLCPVIHACQLILGHTLLCGIVAEQVTVDCLPVACHCKDG